MCAQKNLAFSVGPVHANEGHSRGRSKLSGAGSGAVLVVFRSHVIVALTLHDEVEEYPQQSAPNSFGCVVVLAPLHVSPSTMMMMAASRTSTSTNSHWSPATTTFAATMLPSRPEEIKRKRRRRATSHCRPEDDVHGSSSCGRTISGTIRILFVVVAAAAFASGSDPSSRTCWQVEAFAVHRHPISSRSTSKRQHQHQQELAWKDQQWPRPQFVLTTTFRSTVVAVGSSKAHNHSEKDVAQRKDVEERGSSANKSQSSLSPSLQPPPLLPTLLSKPDLDELVEATQNLAGPIQNVLDEYTGGWALNYADLSPETPNTAVGRGFLMTNLFYLIAGLLLTIQGDPTLGFFTDLAAIASFNYHYTQLRATNSHKEALKDMVRLSLFLDYMAASISILTAIVYLVSTTVVLEPDQLSMVEQSVAVGMVGVFFLIMSWRYEYGRPYIVFHSLWHLGSALSGYLIGSAHLQALKGL